VMACVGVICWWVSVIPCAAVIVTALSLVELSFAAQQSGMRLFSD
jgi:hypothetical protein